MQMMRARSILFFEQTYAEGKNLRAYVVEAVNPDGRSVKLRSMTPSKLPDDLIRNWTISEMRTEIQKGATWLKGFDWALWCCQSADDPFVSSEIPFMAYGSDSRVEDAARHPDTLLLFPLCWQACLVGSRGRLMLKRTHFLTRIC